MKLSNLQKGKWGEQQAEYFLLENGYSILLKNFRTPYGEIDIIALDKDQVVFVEVKTRSNTAFGEPEEAISKPKLARMINCALSAMSDHPEWDDNWRIDMIALKGNIYSNLTTIEHFKNVTADSQ